jgi:hypothetical protein
MTRKVPAVLPAVNLPELEMEPPVADQVTPCGSTVPSLRVPVAVNCAVPPPERVADAGETLTLTRVVTRTEAVSALVPPLWRAMTMKTPWVEPAR